MDKQKSAGHPIRPAAFWCAGERLRGDLHSVDLRVKGGVEAVLVVEGAMI